MTVSVYATWPVEDDPDSGPTTHAAAGSWIWWRLGPHPRGQWRAIHLDSAGVEAVNANRAEFPIVQDEALGEPATDDAGTCHACGYLNDDGYPDSHHHTNCDGVCCREDCDLHGETGRLATLITMTRYYQRGRRQGLSHQAIMEYLDGLQHDQVPLT